MQVRETSIYMFPNIRTFFSKYCMGPCVVLLCFARIAVCLCVRVVVSIQNI